MNDVFDLRLNGVYDLQLNDVSDLQFIVQFVCNGKNMAKTEMKKLKFKHIIFYYKLKRCIKIYLTSLNKIKN
jgi:hypothetical protein